MTDQTTEDAAFFASNPKRKHLLREATEAEILEAGFQAQHVYVVVRRLQTARVRGSQNIEVVAAIFGCDDPISPASIKGGGEAFAAAAYKAILARGQGVSLSIN